MGTAGGVPSPAAPPGAPGPRPHLARGCGWVAGRGGGCRWRKRGSRPCPWRWSRGAAGTPAQGSGPPAAPPCAPRSCRRARGRGRGRADGSLGGRGARWAAGPPVPRPSGSRHPAGTAAAPGPPWPRLTDVGGEPILGPGAAVESRDGTPGSVGPPAAHPGVGRHGGPCRERAQPLSPDAPTLALPPSGAGHGVPSEGDAGPQPGHQWPSTGKQPATRWQPGGIAFTMAGELGGSAPPAPP